MKELDTRVLGQILRELRGTTSQTEIAERTGIAQYTISDLEHGKIERPSFDYIVKLANVYGITPNHLAAAVGLMPAPDESWDKENLEPVLAQAVTVIRTLGSQLEAQQQRDFAIRLEAAIDAQRRAWEFSKNDDSGDSALPSWLRDAIRRP